MIIFNITDLIVFIIISLLILIIYLVTYIRKWLSDMKHKNKLEKNRDLAIRIIDEFESLLSNYDIKIPSEEREQKENEACIYGTQYYDLEQSIIEILDGGK